MQVHVPPSARGAAPPAFPGFVLGPWHGLSPAAGEGASSPKCAPAAPARSPGRRRRGCGGAPKPPRPHSLDAALPLPASAAPGRRQLIAVVSSRGGES
ncbi:PREDICTED: formin-like protein 18 [Colobus angolensis palliatus]|uniref:formin-like protein 18 n=1 Tax=Colobus angolensis palliatus TaxID=336983 RepID=UPI0005F366FC|nr:PREDICTED: formin-like protein 18 [Colobus angolensis palliatus]